jgi:amino-acid N-acetyltransferase
MPETVLVSATSADEEAIRALLLDAELPADDFANHLPHFWVAKQNGALMGVIGLEPYKAHGLLRSLAVAPAYRDQGIGQQLCERMFTYAKTLDIQQLYLLTTTAAEFFPKLGFESADRADVPPSIRTTAEFASICPETAVCMVKKIG